MSNPYTPKADTLPIPVYKIDLSLPANLRYVALAKDFGPKMQTLTHLFDEIVESVSPNKYVRRLIKFLAGILLFRLYSAEETQEIKGIARASGVKLYLLVALNVILDSLLGCTSGGVMVAEKDSRNKNGQEGNAGTRMMHFRTLDWGMEPLRDVLVVLEYVRSDSKEPDAVIARTVTYAGFVGVLTGVRKDLSLSLNFRPYHECSNRDLRIHQLLVLFGLRQSVSSILRKFIVPSSTSDLPTPDLSKISKELETTSTSPCYLILSSGTETAVLEKDLSHARTSISKEFIVATNCDCQGPPPPLSNGVRPNTNAAGMEMIVDDADERQDLLIKRYKDVRKRQEKRWREENDGSADGFFVKVRENTVMGWLQVYPVWNELTHFGCLMDPKKGEIRWIGRGVLDQPIESVEAAEEDYKRYGGAKTVDSAGGWRSV